MKKLVFLPVILLLVFACNKSDDDFSLDGTTWDYTSAKEIEDYILLEKRVIVFQQAFAIIYTIKSTSIPTNDNNNILTDHTHTSLEERIYEYVYNYPVVTMNSNDITLNLTIHKDMKSLYYEENGEKIVFERIE